MTSDQSRISLKLRKMDSSSAADWLIEHYPIDHPRYWEVFQIIPHVSWKRPEQERLAKYYLRVRPFANSTPYTVFASIMSLARFIKIIHGMIPPDSSDREMLLYHLRPILENLAQAPRDKELADALIGSLM